MIPANINITPILPIRGIHYIGQYGTSGYATAAKGYLYHYFINGLPITWDPLYFDNSTLSDDNIYNVVVKSLIGRNLDNYDLVIMHSTPDLWPGYWSQKKEILEGKMVTGYCTWETSHLPKKWVVGINECVGEVWCPSTYNKKVFEESGVTIPIKVVPHIFMPQIMPPRERINLIDPVTKARIESSKEYTFYCIGELNIRKGIEDTLEVFCKAFDKEDAVRLILKVHYKNYVPENKKLCIDIITRILNRFPYHAPVICLLDNMSDSEMAALHTLGDCYISLTKSEGFGLTIFDAFNYGKDVICTGYGGQLDFLGNNHPGLVKYKLGPVDGMDSFSKNYTSEQVWAYPELEHAIELMRRVVR